MDLQFIIILDVTMILMDSIVITDLRRLLLDFLIGARNHKSIRKIHKKQPLKERITLSYIKSYLKKYQSDFKLYHTIYLIYLIIIIPQYILLFTANLLYGFNSRYLVYVLLGVKAVIETHLWYVGGPLWLSKYRNGK